MAVFENVLKTAPNHLNTPSVFATRPATTWLSLLPQSAQLLEIVPVRWDASVQKEWSLIMEHASKAPIVHATIMENSTR